MDFLRKEWKALLIAIWLIGITIYLVGMRDQVTELQKQSIQTGSTLDSVESIILSTDANIVSVVKKVDEIEANVEFVVTKVRRR